ncbi:MAG: RidA family protein [Myxococcota bacterium]
MHEALHPANWPKPAGYAYGLVAEGRTVFLGGQVGWDAEQCFRSDDFVDQARQALRNIVTILEEAGGRPEHLVRLTWFVTSKRAYLDSLPRLGRAYREVLGRHYPAMSLVQVVALVEDEAVVEIEATAVLPST